ncbi:hypothetical protein UPYG_G00255140 [Umbra pygmaea]|uniref:Kinesin motor domain-containing protein n=1 Tax=Umbra pygmaea TaxID=75934 RepID=A0ABD0W963_UMBPY
MASLTRREKERCPAAGNRKYWTTDAPQCKSTKFLSESQTVRETVRPSPEGAGFNTNPHVALSPRMEVPSRGSLMGLLASSGGGFRASGIGSCGSPVVGSWSVRKSDGKVICERCTAIVSALKRQALSFIPQYSSFKRLWGEYVIVQTAAEFVHQTTFTQQDSTLSAFLHHKLQAHSQNVGSITLDDVQGVCKVCGAQLSQLNQEAVHLALTREERSRWASPLSVKPGSTSTKSAPSSPHLSTFSRTNCSSAKPSVVPGNTPSTAPPNAHLTGSTRTQSSQRTNSKKPVKPPAEMSRWVEEQQHLASSSIAMSSNNGATVFPYQFPEFSDGQKEKKLIESSTVPGALSFLLRAAQKWSLMSRKKGQTPALSPECLPPVPTCYRSVIQGVSPPDRTCYRGIIQRAPPPLPTCLIQAAITGVSVCKVRVVLRVRPPSCSPRTQPSILGVDPGKRRVTMMEPPFSQSRPPLCSPAKSHSEEARGLSKTYGFDVAFPRESTQAEVCVGILPDVIRSVVSGTDGCVVCFGHGEMGSFQTMLGSDKNSQSLGVIPCAISWLFSHIERRRREKTGPSLAVSVSAIEVCEDDNSLRDLLSGNLQDSKSADIFLYEDPIYGMQLQNQSVVSSPNAERAAFLLDKAMASRRKCDITLPSSSSNSHLFFTIHIQQQVSEDNSKGDRSRLVMISLVDSVMGNGRACDTRSGRPEPEMGSVIMAILNSGNKNIPNRGRKVTMLLQESVSKRNCHTTVIAHVIDSPKHFSETLGTVQAASRIRRAQKKPKSLSCSPNAGSLSRERRIGSQSFALRAFYSTSAVDSNLSDLPQLRPGRDLLDEHSSSDQSCDTVIHVNTDGSVQLPGMALNRQGPPEFTPIIPALHQNKAEAQSEEAALSTLQKQLLQHLLKIIPRPEGERKKKEGIIQEHLLRSLHSTTGEVSQYERDLSLECDTFAELQERLGCIDGSEAVTKSSLKTSSAKSESTPVLQDGSDNTKTKENCYIKPQKKELKCSKLSIVSEKVNVVTDGLPVDSLQREDSGLYDCEEASAASSTEEQPNPSGSANLHPACQKRGSPAESSYLPQHSEMYSQHGPVPSVHPHNALSHLPLSDGVPGSSDWPQPETRTSPAGKCSPLSPSLSCSLFPQSSLTTSTLANSRVRGEMIQTQLPLTEADLKEMKATITVTVQQPLDEMGQDELVFTLVEEVSISGALERGGHVGNIIRIREAHSSSGQAPSESALCSPPIRIISNVSEDQAPTAGSTDKATDTASTTQTTAVEFNTKPKAMPSLSRALPSFINPSLADICWGSDLEETHRPKGVSSTAFRQANDCAELQRKKLQEGSGNGTQMEPEGVSFITEIDHKRTSAGFLKPSLDQPGAKASWETFAWEDSGCREMKSSGNRVRGKIGNQGDRSDPRGAGDAICSLKCHERDSPVVSSLITPKMPGDRSQSHRNTPENCIHGDPPASYTNLPKGWHDVNKQESYGLMRGDSKDKEQGIMSSPCGSPQINLERRPSSARHGTFSWDREGLPLPLSPAPKHSLVQQEIQRTRNGPVSAASNSLVEPMTYNVHVRHDRLKSPIEESSRLFSAKLEQLASRTNSLSGRPQGFHSLERGSSLSSVSSKGSSKDSKESWEEVSSYPTLPRASRSPKRTPRSIALTDDSPNRANSPKGRRSTFISQPCLASKAQCPETNPSKHSAVGKLMMASPKVRKISFPGTKNLSSSTKVLHQSIYRSASLSPDGKSPLHGLPWSTQSLNRIHTQLTPTAPSRLAQKSPLRVINGRVSELLQFGREPSPCGVVSRGAVQDKVASVAGASCGSMGEAHPLHPATSPYAKVTAPRQPSHLSGNSSDVTSVLSGELPPAMGKTALLTHRNSVVSSGYESMLRDSEATGSSTSTRDSVSDKSWSLISVERNERNPRRRSSNGSHPRRPSHDMSQSLRRSVSGPRSRWVDRGIPEAYEIKVYEIDDVERLKRRGGAGKQGIACFSAKLKFLEHRQERMEELRAKYNSLKRELDLAKHNLMLEPGKWNQEFDLWQTFEVDSLEHLEALEEVTARLESRVNLCKANVMMVTCFDVPTKRRRAKRRRQTERLQSFTGI